MFDDTETMPNPSLIRGDRHRWRDDFRARVFMPDAPASALPWWARAADALTVALAILAAVIAWSGGFRETFGDVRLIVTSWTRIVTLAVAVTAVRHAVYRSPALPARLRAGAARAWASPAVRTALAAVVATRLAVLAAGYFASVIIAPVPGTVLFRDNTDTLSSLSARWDAGWYLSIVQDGYKWDGNRRRQQNVVFFPALPAVMYVSGLVLGKRWLLAGLLIAIGSFAWALVYMFRLARDQLGDDAAVSAVWLIATYPFAVYFSAPYTEGLYLLASLAAFYHVTRREHGPAIAWGIVTGLCRPNGFLLAVPLALLVAVPRLRAWGRGDAHGPATVRLTALQIAVVAGPVAGLALYSAYLWVQVGDPLAWQQGQLAWGRRYVGLWPGFEALFSHRWATIDRLGLMAYTRAQPLDFLNTCAAVLAVGALVPLTRRLGLAYGALVAVNLFPPLLVGGMMSIGRMTSVMFPIFLWLAVWVSPARLPAWTAAFAVLQGLVAVLFFTWRPAF